ncbi:tyrosine-type recombinase/integrase [Rhodococcus sp. IEGM 1330]|uniref:tyrosine-type recombinase/integrase n=1 Tax=Rhodococcus sp. IEGM 1330 TaxID=3082225 RepID=UPI002954A72C|nr:tyrosine-type recombinase/integrase [Rhodococcus sp. IEGM 1330]MDV8021996.1 tyrosine-type recombinase/integrase [Rhodococcus sp. IEGM 1330]
MTQRRNRRAGVEDLWRDLKKPRPVLDGEGHPALTRDGTPVTTSKPKLYGSGKRWRARYVDDSGQERTQRFERKVDAQKWLDSIVSSQVTGNYVDPRLGKITFASFYKEWSSRQVWVPGTVQAMNLAANGVTFANVALGDLRPSHIESWVKAMQDKPLAASTIKTRFNNVRSVLKAAKRDKVLGEDPTERITLPRRRRSDAAMQIPTPLQVGLLISGAEDDFKAFVALAAFAGLRLGEATALQVHDIDFLRREIHAQRQVQRANGGAVEIRAPKYGSERTIPAPQGLLDLLAEYIATWRPGTDADRWLFPGESDNPWHQNSVGYRWRKTKAVAAQPDWHLHDLRHFYASGLIYAGCDVVTVQRALGHSSPNVTLSTYAHLWPNADDRTRKAAAQLWIDASLSNTPSMGNGVS